MNKSLQQFKEAFRENLREVRKENDFTPEDLSKRSGLDAGYIEELEKGKRDPSLETIREISQCLDVEPARLLLSDREEGFNGPSELEHKLRVNKVELKMQQEQIARTENRLRKARDYYWTLFNRAPFPQVTLDLEGYLLEVNNAFRTVFVPPDHPPAETHINYFLEDDDRDTFYRYRNQIFDAQNPDSIVLHLVDNDDRTRACRVQGTGLKQTEGESVILLGMVDVTDSPGETSR